MNTILIQCSNLKPKEVRVDNNFITVKCYEDDKTGNPKTFNPFDAMYYGDNPFKEFASIDTVNLDEIQNFIKKYGILDFVVEKEIKAKDDLYNKAHSFVFSQIKEKNIYIDNNSPVYTGEYYKNLFKYGNDIFEIISRRARAYSQLSLIEETSDFIHESKVMKCILNLYSSKTKKEYDLFVSELELLEPDYLRNIQDIKDVALEESKQNLTNLVVVGNFVTEKLKSIEFSTDFSFNTVTNKYDLKSKYFAPTFLAGLYLMLYFHITNGGIIRQCPVCKRYYDNNNSACPECINTQSSRKYREKKSKDPIYIEFERQRKKMNARLNVKGNKRINKEEYEKWKEAAIKIRDDSQSLEEFKSKIEQIKYKEEE